MAVTARTPEGHSKICKIIGLLKGSRVDLGQNQKYCADRVLIASKQKMLHCTLARRHHDFIPSI